MFKRISVSLSPTHVDLTALQLDPTNGRGSLHVTQVAQLCGHSVAQAKALSIPCSIRFRQAGLCKGSIFLSLRVPSQLLPLPKAIKARYVPAATGKEWFCVYVCTNRSL